MNTQLKLSFLVIIAERKRKDLLLSALSEQGAQVVNVLYGTGSANTGYLSEMFGIKTEKQKAVIICLINDAKLGRTTEMLLRHFDFNSPNTGIAFTVPVENVMY